MAEALGLEELVEDAFQKLLSLNLEFPVRVWQEEDQKPPEPRVVISALRRGVFQSDKDGEMWRMRVSITLHGGKRCDWFPVERAIGKKISLVARLEESNPGLPLLIPSAEDASTIDFDIPHTRAIEEKSVSRTFIIDLIAAHHCCKTETA